MAPLILYHFPPSAPSRAALLAIRNLELDVEIKTVNLFSKEQLAPEFMKVNPQHCVPTIDDDGFYLWESRAIAQYLVETKAPGNTLFPSDPVKRALVNQRLYFDAGTLYPRVRAIAFPAIFLGETKISDDKRKQVYEAFGFMENFLEGRKWFCGDHLTIADLSILASLSSIIQIGASLSDYPNLKRWYGLCSTDVKGYQENDDGAKVFGEKVKSAFNLRSTEYPLNRRNDSQRDFMACKCLSILINFGCEWKVARAVNITQLNVNSQLMNSTFSGHGHDIQAKVLASQLEFKDMKTEGCDIRARFN